MFLQGPPINQQILKWTSSMNKIVSTLNYISNEFDLQITLASCKSIPPYQRPLMKQILFWPCLPELEKLLTWTRYWIRLLIRNVMLIHITSPPPPLNALSKDILFASRKSIKKLSRLTLEQKNGRHLRSMLAKLIWLICLQVSTRFA